MSDRVCRFAGTAYSVANTTFISASGIYRTAFDDYTLLTNFDCSEFITLFPSSLKREIQSRWQYAIHIAHGATPSINRNLLYARVIGGEILGYKYTECSIEGNRAVYYGFISTQRRFENLSGSHKRCRFCMMAVFPRRLYVHLEKVGSCDCGKPGCLRLQSAQSNGAQKGRFCANSIPWTKIYIIMGELDAACNEQIKEPRNCEICAQCFNCSKSVNYCRTHRKCKHRGSGLKRTAAAEEFSRSDSLAFVTKESRQQPKIKKCKTVK